MRKVSVGWKGERGRRRARMPLYPEELFCLTGGLRGFIEARYRFQVNIGHNARAVNEYVSHT